MSEQLKIRVHFGSGRSVDTFLEAPDDIELVPEEEIEDAIRGGHPRGTPAKPCWTWIGDLYLYTQTVEGVELL